MDKIYFILLGIVVVAFFLSIYFATNGSNASSSIGVSPVIQLVLSVPLFIISVVFFLIFKNIALPINTRLLTLLLPFILEIGYFTFTKDIFGVFKSDGLVIRIYLYSISISSILGVLAAWLLGVFK